LPAMEIEDWPEFPVRGVHWDISRCRVPTMETLYALIDRLASWKINVLHLYMEHTFAYYRHMDVWAGYSPLMPEEVEQLDRYCRDRHIELIPFQASFGHMHHWLKHDRYRPLAECPDGWPTPFNPNPDEPITLCPTDPGSLELVASLYEELLPHFSSRRVHAGFDETFELGKGRSAERCEERGVGAVYLDFLKQVRGVIEKHGREMIIYGDVLVHYPEPLKEIPDDVTVQHWGYKEAYPFDRELSLFVEAGVRVWACPTTGTFSSLVGRTHRAKENIRNAAFAASAAGAEGLVNTVWGDAGHWQPLSSEWLGLAYGAAMAWSPQDNAEVDLPAAARDFVKIGLGARHPAAPGMFARRIQQQAEEIARIIFDAARIRTGVARKTVVDDLLPAEIEGPVGVEPAIVAIVAQVDEAALVRREKKFGRCGLRLAETRDELVDARRFGLHAVLQIDKPARPGVR